MPQLNFPLKSPQRDAHIKQLLNVPIVDPIVIVNCSISIPKAKQAINTAMYQKLLDLAIGWEWYAIQPQLLTPIPHIVFAHVDGVIEEIVWAEEWLPGSNDKRVWFNPVYQHPELGRYSACKGKNIQAALPNVLMHSAFYLNC